MKCQNCQRTVTRRSKFCPHCGNEIQHQAVQREAPPAGMALSAGKAAGLIVVGALIGIGAYKMIQISKPAVPNTAAAPQLQSALLLDVASEFNCPCGTCTDGLAECDCDHKNGAQEVKAFIAQKIQEGHKKPHIVEMVAAKYGGLKGQAPAPSFEYLKPQGTSLLPK